jgi:hypothetical protein
VGEAAGGEVREVDAEGADSPLTIGRIYYQREGRWMCSQRAVALNSSNSNVGMGQYEWGRTQPLL